MGNWCDFCLFCYNRSTQDKAYHLKMDSSVLPVFCHMTSITGCGGGGWTLVMKIDGSKVVHRIVFCRFYKVFLYLSIEPKSWCRLAKGIEGLMGFFFICNHTGNILIHLALLEWPKFLQPGRGGHGAGQSRNQAAVLLGNAVHQTLPGHESGGGHEVYPGAPTSLVTVLTHRWWAAAGHVTRAEPVEISDHGLVSAMELQRGRF